MAYAIQANSGGVISYLADKAKTLVWGVTFSPYVKHAKMFESEESASQRLRELNNQGWKSGINVVKLS